MSEVREFYLAMPKEVFALLGASHIGYIKAHGPQELESLYPGAPKLEPGRMAYVLHAADGTPMILADSREAAIRGAASHQLDTVSLH